MNEFPGLTWEFSEPSTSVDFMDMTITINKSNKIETTLLFVVGRRIIEEIPPLVNLLVGIQDELSPHAWELSMHVCGSHILHTILCVMGGLELCQQAHHLNKAPLHWGKAKKKKNRKSSSQHDDEASSSGSSHHQLGCLVFLDQSHIDPMGAAITRSLHQLVETISGNPGMAAG